LGEGVTEQLGEHDAIGNRQPGAQRNRWQDFRIAREKILHDGKVRAKLLVHAWPEVNRN